MSTLKRVARRLPGIRGAATTLDRTRAERDRLRQERDRLRQKMGERDELAERLRAKRDRLRQERDRLRQTPMTHTYDYMFRPAQLCFLATLAERTDSLAGSIVEVRCAFGATTVFLHCHLSDIRSEKRYYALDTFSGFIPEDVAVEWERGRRRAFRQFRDNSKAAFERTMELNGVRRVTAIETDAKTFDFTTIGPFSFCLVDLDLYQPVLATLNAVWDLMTPGGMIVVDDCDANHPVWGGSYEAYTEFVAGKGLPKDIRLTKLGVIQC